MCDEGGDCSGSFDIVIPWLPMVLSEEAISSSIPYTATTFSKYVDYVTVVGSHAFCPIISQSAIQHKYESVLMI